MGQLALTTVSTLSSLNPITFPVSIIIPIAQVLFKSRRNEDKDMAIGIIDDVHVATTENYALEAARGLTAFSEDVGQVNWMRINIYALNSTGIDIFKVHYSTW